MPTSLSGAPEGSPLPSRAVFLSYAREDSAAAQRLTEALRSHGIEVWFDQKELRGGDAWDAKIRRQVKECDLFIALISAHTQARHEGYFRLEWKLAIERSHLMLEGHPFIAPVVVDGTAESGAAVPAEFLRVQWMRLPGALPTPQFVDQVRAMLEPSRPPESPRAASAAARRMPPAVSGSPWLPAALGLLVVGLIAYIFLRRPVAAVAPAPAPPPAAKSAPPAVSDNSVAVLAFVNMSAEKDTEYFSDGISEEILNALARNPGLRVAARTSSFSFKDKSVSIDEIGRALRVANVIEGSVRRSGNKVRITVQLVNARDGYHIWSETFDRDLTDIFAVQDEIAAQVAQQLNGAGAPAVAVAAPTRNPAAYDYYLRARAAETAIAGSRATDAMRLYDEALRLDPDYAVAWAHLAEECARIYSTGFDRSDEVVARAHAAAGAALRLASDLPEAHLAQSLVLTNIDSNFADARRELDRVDQLQPNNTEAPAQRATLAFESGQWGDPLGRLVAQAVETDPQNAGALLEMGTYLSAIGHYAAADRLFERAAAAGESGDDVIWERCNNRLDWDADTTAALALLEKSSAAGRVKDRFYYQRAYVRVLQGDYRGAIADYRKWRALFAGRFADKTGPRIVMALALFHIARLEAQQGRTAAANRDLRDGLAEAESDLRDFPHDSNIIYARALFQAALGQPTAALASMDQSAAQAAAGGRLHTRDVGRERARVLAILGRVDAAVAELQAVGKAGVVFGYSLHNDPDLATLRASAKFQQLMKAAEAAADSQPRPIASSVGSAVARRPVAL